MFGAVEIVFLQDSAEDPILARHRIEHTDGDLSFPEWVDFTTPDQPFTQWPVRLLSIPDMDGNGIDELWCVFLRSVPQCLSACPSEKPNCRLSTL